MRCQRWIPCEGEGVRGSGSSRNTESHIFDAVLPSALRTNVLSNTTGGRSVLEREREMSSWLAKRKLKKKKIQEKSLKMSEDPHFLKGKIMWILETPDGVCLTARVLSRILEQSFLQMACDYLEENMIIMRS